MIVGFNLINTKKISLPYKLQVIEEVGKGAHGEIYKCSFNDKYLALKIVKNTVGLNHLVEACIMTQITHPNINQAIAVFNNESNMFIIQELALCDLANYIDNNIVSDEMKDKWINSLINSIYVLHKNNIIHCDIKAKNILLYNDMSIKLTDFSSSVKKLTDKDSFRHRISTWTHMPLESVMKYSWDEKVDIWCLGCTVYEIYFNSMIFNYDFDNTSDNDLKMMTINSLTDWGINGPIKNHQDIMFCSNIFDREYNFNKFKLHNEFTSERYPHINKIITSCLLVNSKLRCSINDLVVDKNEYSISTKNKSVIADSILANVKNKMKEKLNNNQYNLIPQALHIYQSITNENIDEEIKIEACIVIASKLFLRKVSVLKDKKDEILKAESIICNNLQFRLLNL